MFTDRRGRRDDVIRARMAHREMLSVFATKRDNVVSITSGGSEVLRSIQTAEEVSGVVAHPRATHELRVTWSSDTHHT